MLRGSRQGCIMQIHKQMGKSSLELELIGSSSAGHFANIL